MFVLSQLPLRDSLEALFDPQTHLVGSTEARTHIFRSLELLILLGQDGEWERMEQTLGALLDLQETDESQPHFGWMPLALSPTAPTYIDFNAPLFIAPYLLHVWEHYREPLSPSMRGHCETALWTMIKLGEARWSSELFEIWRDHVAYSNIFLLYIGMLLEAGRVLGDAHLSRNGWGQWRRWFNHISYFGIDEFASPTYGKIDYQVLLNIERLAGDDEQKRAEVVAAKRHLGALQLALFHPELGLQVSGSARDYRHWIAGGVQSPVCLGDEGFAADSEGARALDEFHERQFPFQARGRAGTMPFRFQTWQEKTAALGSMSGGNVMWQQVHCMGAVGLSSDQRAAFFLPGRYTPTPGFVAQRQNRALCLFGRFEHAFHRTQWLLPPEWTEKSFGDFGVGLSSGWQIESNSDQMRLDAFDWSVHLWPFVIEGEKVVSCALEKHHRTNFGQSMFHQTGGDFEEWIWPREARWFGCEVLIAPMGEAIETPIWTWQHGNDAFSLASSSELQLRLWQAPDGEIVELYNGDPRTFPLFESRAHTLWPGQLTAQILRDRFA